MGMYSRGPQSYGAFGGMWPGRMGQDAMSTPFNYSQYISGMGRSEQPQTPTAVQLPPTPDLVASQMGYMGGTPGFNERTGQYIYPQPTSPQLPPGMGGLFGRQN